MRKKIRENLGAYFVCLILSAVVTAFFVTSSSPLYSIYDSVFNSNDVSALFVLSGLDGVLYRDLFVTGGPVFYGLMLPVCGFGGRTGLFVFDILLLFLTLAAVYHFTAGFLSKKKALFLTVFTAIPYAALVSAGNTAEGIVLLLFLFCLLYTLRMKKTERKYDGLIMGILAGLCVMTRFTAGGFVYGLFLYAAGSAIRRRTRKKAGIYLLTAVAGMLLCAAPFVVYYGYQGALGDFLDGAFLFDLYFNFPDVRTAAHKAVKIFPALAVFLLSIARRKGMRNGILAAGSLVQIFFSLTGPVDWYTYLPMVICVPIAVVLLKPYKHKKAATVLFLLACLVFYSFPLKNTIEFLTGNDTETDELLVSDLNSYYEDVDNDTLLLLNVPLYYYLETGTSPQFKYFYNQETLVERDSSIQEEIYTYIEEDSTNAIIITRSSGFMSEQIGDYYLVDMYYKGRTVYAIYEYILE